MPHTFKNHGIHVAIVGATGVVGQEILRILEEQKISIAVLSLLASKQSIGKSYTFNEEECFVEELTEQSFKGVDFALFSAGASISKHYAPIAAKAGATVIDNTSQFRMEENIPLVVPEVNKHALSNHQGIIANPNCSTAQLVVALKPIYDLFGIKRIITSTYQSVSGAGKEAITELESHSQASLSGQVKLPQQFTKPIAFNVIPHIDVFQENAYTKEEMKMTNETKKIFEDPELQLSATCVRVPVFVGHSEAVNVECKKEVNLDVLKEHYKKMDSVYIMDDPANNEYPTPRETAGTNPVYIGRIRHDISRKNCIELWVVADNLRKGAALNAVQIMKEMI